LTLIDELKNFLSKYPLENNQTLARTFKALVFEYLRKVFPGEQFPESADIYEEINMIEENFAEWSENLRKEGLQKGHQKGFQEGQVKTLSSFLVSAFGQDVFDRKARTLLQAATPYQLDVWTKRAFAAKTIDEVFDD
jgi:flagellar biosynthesis/type III secretory pathway protein FliH